MADEATKTAEAVDQQSTEKPVEGETKAAPDTQAETIKSLQRELQRARNRLDQFDRQTARTDALQVSVDAIAQSLQGQESLDETSRDTMGRVHQLSRSQSENEAVKTALTNQIRDVAASFGVTSWDDPRVAEAVEAFEEGDYNEALSLVKQARRQHKAKAKEETTVPKKEDAKLETRIAAEVERRMKEMGVREVDKTKAGAPAPVATIQELLAKNLNKMTPAERQAHSTALLEASRKG